MAHGYSVIDGYGIELGGKTAHLFNFFLHQLADVLQVNMARNELGEGVDNGNDRFSC